MHTNFDVLGMADLSADYLELKNREILEVTYDREGRQEGLGRVGNLAEAQTLEAFGRFVKEKFQLPFVKVYGDLNKMVERVAVCTRLIRLACPDVKAVPREATALVKPAWCIEITSIYPSQMIK